MSPNWCPVFEDRDEWHRRVIVKGAIFPTVHIKSNNLTCSKVLREEKRKQIQLLDLPIQLLAVAIDVSLEMSKPQLPHLPNRDNIAPVSFVRRRPKQLWASQLLSQNSVLFV